MTTKRDFTNWLPLNLKPEEIEVVRKLEKMLAGDTIACSAVAVMMLEACNHHTEAQELNDKIIGE